jgi:hypothetical protein
MFGLRIIDGSINPHSGAPEAKVNFFTRYEHFQIQLAPAMEGQAATQIP